MHSASTVISAVIYQLLKSKRVHSLIRDDKRCATLKHGIEDLSVHPATKPAEKLSKLYSILAELLTDLALKRIFIVLDGVDRIQGNIDNFLSPLLKLMETTECVLKVFITIRTKRDFDDSLLKESMSRDTYTRVILDQPDWRCSGGGWKELLNKNKFLATNVFLVCPRSCFSIHKPMNICRANQCVSGKCLPIRVFDCGFCHPNN
jgi:hypothetical protein